jgi:hypothetical protein
VSYREDSAMGYLWGRGSPLWTEIDIRLGPREHRGAMGTRGALNMDKLPTPVVLP